MWISVHIVPINAHKQMNAFVEDANAGITVVGHVIMV